jgi:hypothetical protein
MRSPQLYVSPVFDLLYALVETGHAEMDELLRGRIIALKVDRETALGSP